MGNNSSSGGQGQSEQKKNHSFRLNNPDPEDIELGTNTIKSTNYTALTFIPLNLLHQLKTLANIYFVLICILQTIPGISVTHGKPTTVFPLAFVLLTVLIKDAYEEFCRYQKDKAENNRQAQILKDGHFVEGIWQDICPGQIIKILEGDIVPCDCIVLKTTLPDNKCFIETKSLDGETNLKLRKAPFKKKNFDNLSNHQLSRVDNKIQVEPPHQFLNRVNGFFKLERQDLPISIENVLLRGCHLRNCKQVICAATYVGSNTKVILNSAKFNAKRSKLMTEIDKMIVNIFIWQLIIALVVATFNTLFQNSYQQVIDYIGSTRFWLIVPSWWLLMTYFVPISLIVTMELIKLFQGSVMANDPIGYSKQYQCFVSANNTSINESLGQIKYVFTDKTGTLTKNQMNFKKIIVDGEVYGNKSDIPVNQVRRNYPQTNNVDFRDSSFLNKLDYEQIQNCLKVLYLCHEIIVNKEGNNSYDYNSSSPDEIALINFAKLCGKQLIQEEGQFIRIMDRKTKSTLKFKKLAFLEFNSDRKRMSVIVQLPNGQIQILTKGADSIIEKLLAPRQAKLEVTKNYLEDFSIQGLRTLLLARRTIPKSQFDQWLPEYQKAQASIKDRQENLSRVYDIIQKNLQLIGGTAVEDKLQDNVSETITTMKKAGIKFFILTGDKKQTAVNIGRSCGLVDRDAKLVSYPQEYLPDDRSEKVYLIDASSQIPTFPADLLQNQTICYRCTPVQKQNIVRHVKSKVPDLTLAIGDGANDVNMILAADVGVGVKGKQGTQATRVADVAVGEFQFLSFITLYYGRQWYKKNARLVCYNFFKNWYHVAAVIFYGAYSYFSAVVIFDIFSYELFNAFFAALPIMIYAIFDLQYSYEDSLRYPDLYESGLHNKEFNQVVYHKNILIGIVYGFFSIVTIFMVLESEIINSDGRVGYFYQSGAVLFFSIILVANLRIFVLSSGISIGLFFSVLIGIIMYWMVYFIESKFLQDFILLDSISQEWKTPAIILLHFIIVFFLIGIQLIWDRYQKLKDWNERLLQENTRNFLVDQIYKEKGLFK